MRDDALAVTIFIIEVHVLAARLHKVCVGNVSSHLDTFHDDLATASLELVYCFEASNCSSTSETTVISRYLLFSTIALLNMATLFDSCPSPFLDFDDYPSTAGYLPGQFCGPLTSTLNCCLPCPLKQWMYSDDYDKKEEIASWFNVPALICQVLLLVTMAVLPKERHYLSVGLCVSLIMLEVGG